MGLSAIMTKTTDLKKSQFNRANTLMKRWNKQVGMYAFCKNKFKNLYLLVLIILTPQNSRPNAVGIIAYINRPLHLTYLKAHVSSNTFQKITILVPVKFMSFRSVRGSISIPEMLSARKFLSALVTNKLNIEQTIINEIYFELKTRNIQQFICAGAIGKPAVLTYLFRRQIPTKMLVTTDLPKSNKILKCFNNYSPKEIINFNCHIALPRFQSYHLNEFRIQNFVLKHGTRRNVFISQPVLKLRILTAQDIKKQCEYMKSHRIQKLHIKWHPREPLWERYQKYRIFAKYFKIHVISGEFNYQDTIYSYNSTLLSELSNNGLRIYQLDNEDFNT